MFSPYEKGDCMAELEIIFEPEPKIVDAIDGGLTEYNLTKLGGWACHHLAVVAKNDQVIIGGLYGTLQWDWLEIDFAWVDESRRGEGFGTKLVKAAEVAAVSKGVHNVHLRTGSWQAVGFYEKLGYNLFGQLEDYPDGFTTYFMKKRGL